MHKQNIIFLCFITVFTSLHADIGYSLFWLNHFIGDLIAHGTGNSIPVHDQANILYKKVHKHYMQLCTELDMDTTVDTQWKIVKQEVMRYANKKITKLKQTIEQLELGSEANEREIERIKILISDYQSQPYALYLDRIQKSRHYIRYVLNAIDHNESTIDLIQKLTAYEQKLSSIDELIRTSPYYSNERSSRISFNQMTLAAAILCLFGIYHIHQQSAVAPTTPAL